MTNHMTPEQILYQLHGYEKGDVPFLDLQIAEAVEAINALLTEARINELEPLQKSASKNDTSFAMIMDSVISERIAELKKEASNE